MNESPRVSIIVPVYNAETYLTQCIDSILAQDFTDFELLLIDDGSKDKSGIICDGYIQKDKRVRIFHKKNGGVSSARNMGLDYAKGSHVCFIDADDYILKDYLAKLVSCNADFVCCGNKTIDKTNNREIIYPEIKIEKVDIGKCLSSLIANYPIGVPWGKMFRRDILKKYNIKFDEKLFVGEDHVFVQQYLMHCQTLQFIPYVGYNYCYVSNTNKYLFTESQVKYFIEKVIGTYSLLCQTYHFNNEKLLYQNYLFCISHYLISQSKNYKFSIRNIKPGITLLSSINIPVNVFEYAKKNSSRRDNLILHFLKYKRFALLIFIFRFLFPIYKL